MEVPTKKKYTLLKKMGLLALVLFMAGIIWVWYISGSYVIFAFQQQDKGLAEKIKVGEKVSIKGSCSGGAFSKILETEYITFKRCAINH